MATGRFGGFCHPDCTTDAECPFPYQCLDNACQPVACQLDAECLDGRVCRRSESSGLGYCTVPSPGCLRDDGSEENDTQSTATELEPRQRIVNSVTICDVEDDWYRVPVAAGSQVEVSASWSGDADLDLFAFDEGGGVMAAATEFTPGSEVLQVRYTPGPYFWLRVNQVPFWRDFTTDYSFEISTTAGACTAAGEECLTLAPLRIDCDEASGACVFLQGHGEVPLGGLCDSTDDCSPDAEFCWSFQSAMDRRNICTVQCAGDSDCAGIAGATCQAPGGGGFQVCLP